MFNFGISFKGENMKKRLICLTLVLVMLAGLILTGCGKKTEDEVKDKISAEASAEATTLSFYLITEQKVSAETEKRIEDAMNAITEDQFKTRLDLRLYTEDEYYTALSKAIADRNAARANGNYSATVASKPDPNALIQYPVLAPYQVDIFYLGGADVFNSYKNAGELANLTSSINNASKQLIETLPSQYFGTMTRLDKNIYGVPSNQAIGEYTYLLLNKDALASTYMSAKSFTSLTDEACQDFLAQICESATLSERFAPIYTNVENKLDLISNLEMIGVDANGAYADVFSVIGGYTTDSADARLGNLTANTKFMNALKTLKGYELNGYYATAEEVAAGREFAVGVIKGGAELVEVYGDEFELVVLEKPVLTVDELYSNLMCVSQYTTNVERCMEIVTYLNTNEEFRNLLLYGVEGKDYHLIDTKVVKNEFGETYKVAQRVSGTDYVMAPEKTGNTFITYQLQAENMIYSLYEYGILQNKDVSTAWDLSFSISYAGAPFVNLEWMTVAQTISNEILTAYTQITDMTAYADFEKFVEKKVLASVKANDDALAELNVQYEAALAELQKAEEDNKAAIEALTAAYNERVAELEASKKFALLVTPAPEGDKPHNCAGLCGSLKCYYATKAGS